MQLSNWVWVCILHICSWQVQPLEAREKVFNRQPHNKRPKANISPLTVSLLVRERALEQNSEPETKRKHIPKRIHRFPKSTITGENKTREYRPRQEEFPDGRESKEGRGSGTQTCSTSRSAGKARPRSGETRGISVAAPAASLGAARSLPTARAPPPPHGLPDDAWVGAGGSGTRRG